MKKLLSILLLLPIYLLAQKGTEYYSCCEGHNPCLQIYGEEALRQHNCNVHGIGCSSDNTSNIGSGKLSKSPVAAGLVGSLLTGLAGSLITAPNGENQAVTGAAIGYGVFSTLSLLINKKKRSVGENFVTGALIGGSLAYAASKSEQAYNKQTIPPKTDNSLLIAGGGALLVGTLEAVTGFHKKTKGGYNSFQNRKKISMSNMAFIMKGNKIGIVVNL